MLNIRYENEMMQELALVAVREVSDFYTDGSQFSLPDGRGHTFVYNIDFLDIRFIETGRKDCVVRFRSVLAPFAPHFYCLLSELNREFDYPDE